MALHPYITGSGFIILTGVTLALLFKEFSKAIQSTSWPEERRKKTLKRYIVVLAGWFLFVTAWSWSGMMLKFEMFPLNIAPVVIIPLLTLIILVFFSPSFAEIVVHIPQERLAVLQGFRVVVEIFLWILYLENVVPIQATFEGRNFDILAGISGPLIAWLLASKRISNTGLWIWNFAGLGLLINIVSIAILSLPTSIRAFTNEPVLTVVAEFPVSLLPGFLVPLAYMLHFMSMRKLYLEGKK